MLCTLYIREGDEEILHGDLIQVDSIHSIYEKIKQYDVKATQYTATHGTESIAAEVVKVRGGKLNPKTKL